MRAHHLAYLLILIFQLYAVSASSRDFLALPSRERESIHTTHKSQRELSKDYTKHIEREFAKILREGNFHGDWTFMDSSTPLNTKLDYFENRGGILKMSTSKNADGEYISDILFVDGSNMDKKFVVVSFHQKVFADNFDTETSSFQIKDYPITYRKGTNFFVFTGFIDKTDLLVECTFNSFMLTFWNTEDNRPFKISEDKMQNLRIKVNIQSQDCGFVTEGSLVRNYGNKFNFQIWLYISLVSFCIFSQLIALIIKDKFFNYELTLPHRFQLSFILTLNIQFVRINLMFFGHYLFDFSRAWVFLLVALAFFVIFLLELRLLIQIQNESYESYSWGPYAALGLFICFLMFSSDYYWILYPYIMTPLMDVLQSYTCSRRWRFSFSFYIGHLLPFLTLIGYFKWYQDNFAKFSPTPPVFHWCGFFIFLGLSWLTIRSVIKKLHPDPVNPTFKVLDVYEGEADDCAICLEHLQSKKDNSPCNKASENADETQNDGQKTVTKDPEETGTVAGKIVKTSCNHYFHKKCVEKWVIIKPVCPLCCAQL